MRILVLGVGNILLTDEAIGVRIVEALEQRYILPDYVEILDGGTAGCTMNGANEVAVAAFLARRCGYLEIVRSIEYALGKSSFAAVPSLGDLGEANAEARCLAAEYLRL